MQQKLQGLQNERSLRLLFIGYFLRCIISYYAKTLLLLGTKDPTFFIFKQRVSTFYTNALSSMVFSSVCLCLAVAL
jgi:hypothetical protein